MDPDPIPDPTPLFKDFKETKKNFSPILFSYNLSTGTLSSVLKIKCYNFVLKSYFASIISEKERIRILAA
jgi:hypothetical protein